MIFRSLIAASVLLVLSGSVDGKELKKDTTAVGTARTSAPAAEAPATGVQAKLAEIRRLAESGDETGAYHVLVALLDEPSFDTLPESTRNELLALAGSIAWTNGQIPEARSRYRQATRLAGNDAQDWNALAWLALAESDTDDAAIALAEQVRRWPESAPDIDEQLLFGVLNTGYASDKRFALLEALYAADYAPRLTGDGSAVWRLLAEQQVDRGQPEAAKATLARISSTPSLIRVLIDRRFDGLIDRDAPQFDLERAARARIADLRARAILDPGKLEIQAELLSAMLAAGQNEDAAALTAEIAAAASSDSPPYSDLEEKLPWVLNLGATACIRLERIECAIRLLEQAATMSEHGQQNVSQTLNLGQLYNNLGRYDEAQATVAKVEKNMSVIGRMVQANAKLRAALETGDTAAADRAMAFLRENRAASGTIYYESLFEAGELDEAAQLVIEMLESPAERAEALESLQAYPEQPELPGEKRYNEGRRRLNARADVLAAVERVGRVLPNLPVHRDW